MKLSTLTLPVVFALAAWALWPRPSGGAAEVAPSSNPANVKYVIRVAPGFYMPDRRPMDVGKPLQGLNEVAADFEKLYPDTRIEFVDVPSVREWVVTQLAAGTAPDIMNINVEDVWQDVQKGWYVPLDSFLEQSNPFVPKGSPGSRQWWDMFKYQAISRGKAAPDGKMYCLTLDMIETGIFYNKSLFAKFGVSPPKDWVDFLRIQQIFKDAGYTPMLVDSGAIADWGVDLLFDQLYDQLLPGIDLSKDPKREQYLQGYLDWDEICYLHGKGYFTKDDARYLETFRIMKDWRRFMPLNLSSVDLTKEFINQRGPMWWSSSLSVYKLARDPDMAFPWGVFYLPAIPKSYSKYANGHPMCVIGGSATQLELSNSAIQDTHDVRTSERLKRCVAFLQFLCLPKNTDRVVNEWVALLPNIKGVPVQPELQPFDTILKRQYGTTKWMFTFDLRFDDVYQRMLELYLNGGVSLSEFVGWMQRDIDSGCSTVVRRKHLDLSKFDPVWRSLAPERARMEDLPHAP